MAQRKMLDSMDDIASQARQGSVAAIIQTLNEQLTETGVRTRAIFADGLLQLLCEAASKEQLDQSVLVPKIRQILEGISPCNIRRVKINSRLVREQQLLWLEEIMRDPDKQLLWSETITLTKPNLFKRLAEGLKNHSTLPTKKNVFPKSAARIIRDKSEKSPYKRGIVSGVSLSLLLMVAGWLLYDWLHPRLKIQIQTQVPNSQAASQQTAATPTAIPTPDSFVQAVRLAEQAAVAGQTVKTAAQWLDLAAKWERASDLMSAVKPDDPRYKTAQDRMKLYRKNSEVAQQQARKSRS